MNDADVTKPKFMRCFQIGFDRNFDVTRCDGMEIENIRDRQLDCILGIRGLVRHLLHLQAAARFGGSRE